MHWIILLLLPTALFAEDLLLASWNIRIYSTGSRDDAELELIGLNSPKVQDPPLRFL
jgi:hypothetical protein